MDKKPQNENLDLIFLIDRSGSMSGSESDTIGGFNSFVERELKKELPTRVTTILFDHGYDVLYTRKPIEDVNKLTEKEYFVRGSTALLDAIGRTINTLDKEIDNNVLFVIITDGYENSSREYTKAQIKNLIDNHNWEFIYIGADIDSYGEASSFGFSKSRIANFEKSDKGIDDMFNAVEDASYCVRENRSIDESDWKRNLEKYD